MEENPAIAGSALEIIYIYRVSFDRALAARLSRLTRSIYLDYWWWRSVSRKGSWKRDMKVNEGVSIERCRIDNGAHWTPCVVV